MPRTLLLFVGIGLFLASTLAAQQPSYRNYRVGEGMPSSEVYDAYQDERGYMWFATDHGIARYDGAAFEVFTTEDGLCDNTVFGFHPDAYGRIWYRSIAGCLGFISGDTIHPFHLPLKDGIDLLAGKNIEGLIVDQDSTLWIATSPWYEAPNFLRVNLKTGEVSTSMLRDILIIIDNGHGQLLATGRSVGVRDRNHLTPSMRILDPTTQIFDMPWLEQLKMSAPAGIWNEGYLVGLGTSVYFISRQGELKEVVDFGEVILDMSVIGSDVWVSGAAQGAIRYTCAPNDPLQLNRQRSYFTQTSIVDVKRDFEGGYWFCTLERGLLYIPDLSVSSIKLENDYGSCVQIAPRADGGVWVGTKTGNVLGISAELDMIESHVLPTRLGRDDVVEVHAHEQAMWGSGSLGTFALSSSRWTPITDFTTYSVAEKDGISWYNHRRYLSRWKSGKLLDSTHCGPATRFLTGILPVDDSTAYLGSVNGLLIYRNGKIADITEPEILDNVRITGMHPLKKPNGDWEGLLMSTRGHGLLVWKDGDVQAYGRSDGLSSNMIDMLHVDGDWVWLSGNFGMDRISLDSTGSKLAQVLHFGQAQGLISNSVNEMTSSGNHIWAAVDEGVCRFPRNWLPVSTVPARLVWTAIRTPGATHATQSPVEVPFAENDVQFSFKGISFQRYGPLRYVYRLVGHRNDWLETQVPEIQFTNLPPGTYEFQVRVDNGNGMLSEALVMPVTIKPAWWHRLWFRICLAIFFIGMLIGLIRYVMWRSGRRSQLKAELNETRLSAVAAQLNPHFIFNSLNSIQYYILSSDKKNANRFLGHFSDLIRKNLENSTEALITLSRELESLKLYLELEHLRFPESFTYTVDVRSRRDMSSVKVPAMILQPYVENAVMHGLSRLDGDGLLNIEVYDEGKAVICRIMDNGIGRKHAEKQRRTGHRSMGMKLNEKKVELVNSLFRKRILIQINDANPNDPERPGTVVQIKIPV